MCSMIIRQSVIILGSNPATKLGLIRSVGEAIGCPITVINMVYELPKGDYVPVDCASKYVTKHLFALKFHPEDLCDTLLKNCIEKECKPVILSVDDDSAYMIDTLQDKLNPYFICANIGGKQGGIAELMNKQLQKQLAEKYGFKVSRSWPIEYRDGHYEVPDDISYPCYVKGLLSYHTLKKFQGRCNSREELLAKVNVVAKESNSPLMAEEFLEIEKDFGVIGFCDGKTCTVPAMVELLDSGHGSHKGVSAFGLVRKHREDENILDLTKRLVESLSLFGLFNVDLVMSKGELYFVELNLRFAAYGYAVTRAGANLPALMVKRCMGVEEQQTEVHILKDCYYLNERVGLDDVVGGYRSFKEYKDLKRKADFGLMENEEDPEPYLIFKRQIPMNYFKQRIKQMLKR